MTLTKHDETDRFAFRGQAEKRGSDILEENINMGAGESTAVVAPTLDALHALPPELQRNLFRSVEMMARRDAATPGRF